MHTTTLRSGTLLSATLLTVSTLLSGACSNTVTHVYRQRAVVAPPSGPRAAGPVLDHLEVGLEAGGAITHVADAEQTRAQGAPGHYVIEGQVFGRAALGLFDHLELGVTLEYARSSWSKATAVDLGAMPPPDEHVVTGGTEVRGVFYRNDWMSVGANLELGVLRVPYELSMNGAVLDRETRTYVTLRTGPLVHFRPLDLLHVGVGTTLQTHPVYYGEEAVTGVSPSAPPPASLDLVAVGWVDAALDLGPVALIGQLHFPMISLSGWHSDAPVGGKLSMRFHL
jgi:hypothetical protein